MCFLLAFGNGFICCLPTKQSSHTFDEMSRWAHHSFFLKSVQTIELKLRWPYLRCQSRARPSVEELKQAFSCDCITAGSIGLMLSQRLQSIAFHSRAQKGATPFHILFGHSPDYHFWIILGCLFHILGIIIRISCSTDLHHVGIALSKKKKAINVWILFMVVYMCPDMWYLMSWHFHLFQISLLHQLVTMLLICQLLVS